MPTVREKILKSRMSSAPIEQVIFTRMTVLMDLAIQTGKATSRSDWFEKIGGIKQNWVKLVNNEMTFTHAQISAGVSMVGASFDFVFGKIDTINHL